MDNLTWFLKSLFIQDFLMKKSECFFFFIGAGRSGNPHSDLAQFFCRMPFLRQTALLLYVEEPYCWVNLVLVKGQDIHLIDSDAGT